MNIKKILFPITLAATIFCNIIVPITSLASSEKGMEVRYEGEAKKLISTSDNFFEGFQTMLPGDTISETIYLNNLSESTIDFYFRTELTEELTKALIQLGKNKPEKDSLSRSAALLRDTTLKIEILDQNKKPILIYEGSLAATALEDFRKVGHYKSNEGGTFTFTLTLPTSLTNIYSVNNTDVIWIFGVNEISLEDPTSPIEPTDPSVPTNPIEPSNPAKPTEPTSSQNPTSPSRESGDRDPSPNQILGIDNYKFYLGIGLVGISIIGFIILAVRRKK